MPALSPTMETGKITEWFFKEGDEVCEGDTLADIETDKSTVGFETTDGGYIAKILYDSGLDLAVGKGIIIIVENQEDIAAFKDYKVGEESVVIDEFGHEPIEEMKETPKVEVKAEPKTPNVLQREKVEEDTKVILEKQKATVAKESPKMEQVERVALGSGDGRLMISPIAKRKAIENGINLDSLIGLGTDASGRITVSDVENYIKNAKSAPAPTEAPKAEIVAPKPAAPSKPAPVQKTQTPALATDVFEDKPVTGMRKVIAQRLSESKQTIPHYYLSTDVEMNNLIAFRKDLNEGSDNKLSVSDFIIKACALSCIDVPEANSQWMGTFIRQFNNVNVSFAVSTDGGLITPTVNNADDLRIGAIASATKDLISRARVNKLKPEEYSNGTFTISNLGMMGVTNFCAVINPPQSSILAIGSTVKAPKYDVNAVNNLTWVDNMTVTLSCDHRVVDGAVGATWLQRFKFYMENPMKMLV